MNTRIVTQVRLLLKWTLGLGAILVGGDKFFNLTTSWAKYVSQPVADFVPFDTYTLLLIIGVIEVIVGVLILSRLTQKGAYMLAAWFGVVIINLILLGGYGDIILRDAMLGLSAVALGRLYAADNRLLR